jgi:hypothetical protein
MLDMDVTNIISGEYLIDSPIDCIDWQLVRACLLHAKVVVIFRKRNCGNVCPLEVASAFKADALAR